ncbi:MAG: transcription elongation factor GreA [Clostridia bacterium]|nr:transcription elongation factor GreA [Clostridia bacterium]MBR0406573.1 transcription elongation factor GreA [Clostridia bacterium]
MSEMDSNSKKIVVSAEGLRQMEEKLKYMTTVRRAEVAEHLSVARGFGDLSENAEYDEAKDEQAKLEADIIELEAALSNVVVIDDSDVSTDAVSVGTTVRVLYLDEGEEEEFMIVGPRESDPMNNKISNESPIGSAMMRHKVGEVVTVEAPDGPYELRILEIKL